jgi:predicted alpha/beta superfamily hydrolase
MVRIYLPLSYENELSRRFPVLYVHDGQNAFSTVGTNVAFGWGNWDLDRTVTDLCRAGRLSELILVAVDCSSERYLDYRGPARDKSPEANRRYEAYREFLIQELKPRIDREYRTRRAPEDTGVLGSSMGGLCSLALAWDRPDIFGKAASLSGAFQVERSCFVTNVVGRYVESKKPVRIYIDSGVVDFSGGDDGRKWTDRLAEELRRIGWREGNDLRHFVDEQPMTSKELERAGLRPDKWEEAQRSQHNEFYWRVRAWRALEFLFPPTDGGKSDRPR